MENKICRKCGADILTNRFFCLCCGGLLNADSFNDPDICEVGEFKVSRIRTNIEQVPHMTVDWDETMDAYAKKMETFRALMRIDDLSSNADGTLIERMDSFIGTCRNPEFQIAFVGTIKTGKSTLINALLGHNYASMAVTPETAALTKFRSSERDYIKVSFYSKKEWAILWKSITSGADKFMDEYNRLGAEKFKEKWIGHEALKKEIDNSEIEKELSVWSSSRHPEHYFVKEIEVGISSLSGAIPKEVVFVDTPGLSDPVVYRSEITKRYIKRANAVFVCVEAKKLNKEEVDTISSVFSISSHNKEKVYIIGTHWDMLNHPVEDWCDSKEFMTQQITGKGFFDNETIAKNHLIHASAYQYNLCRDFDTIDSSEKRQMMRFALGLDLDFSDLSKIVPELKKHSNIDTISEIIRDKLVKNFSVLIRDDLINQYHHIVKDLVRYAETTKEKADKIITASHSSMEELKKHVQEASERHNNILQSRKQLISTLDMVCKNSQKRLARMIASLDESLK